MSKLYDKTGREIMAGDIVKVFHFTAAVRRKRHYIYKQALGMTPTNGGYSRMKFSHLNLDGEGYSEIADGRLMDDYEIVQSVDAKFDERPRISLPVEEKIDA